MKREVGHGAASSFILPPSSLLVMLSQVVELIEKKDRFAITSHVRPDGDGLGASLGLFWLLKALNKEAEVIMHDPAPHSYRRLQRAKAIRGVPNADRNDAAI